MNWLSENPDATPAEIEQAIRDHFHPPVNQKPTGFTLSDFGLSLEEGRTTARKLADIIVTDDGLGSNTVRLLTNPNLNLFQIRAQTGPKNCGCAAASRWMARISATA